ncbi:hypothetical protein GCU56_13540 [Geodermatophilus sabuli]|uniref:Uncharacterized protein n=1 Tax=Geodermatophilus sabuli TaxID=1564158 RepID=A0A7K3W2N0_9ACTN|nr:hypothetical protein [Geodermatophilus sabuli]NEK58888.1 hypothetical protein [Geodermatophilus sabuli]
MNRVVAAARLHLVHPLVMLGIPWLIVGLSFAINLAVWHLTPAGEEDSSFTGGLASLYITVMVVYVQAFTQLLSFAMGVSLSRRTFFLGTALVAVGQALGYGVAVAALAAIERATDGWGARLEFWMPLPGVTSNPVLQALIAASIMLAFMFTGIGMGIVYKRWGANGMWTLVLVAVVLLGAAGILVTWAQAWGDIGSWFADQSTYTLTIGLPLALVAVLAAASFTANRRTVP